MKHRKALKRRYGRSVIGREMRIPKRSLAMLMYPWGADSGSGLPTYAVASYYDNAKVYPDKHMVERAIAEAERTIPLARAGAHGWTLKDARELERIAGGLRYWLRKDYL